MEVKHESNFFVYRLYDPNSHSFIHISYCKSSQRRIVCKSFTSEGLLGFHEDISWITIFKGIRVFLFDSSGSAIDFGLEFLKFTGNVRSMAINDGSIAFFDGTWVIEDDKLGNKVSNFFRGVIIGFSSNISSFNFISL